MDAVFIMIIRLSGVQFGLKTYKWFTKSDDYIAGVQFFLITIIIDRIGWHKVLLLINQTMTKFEKETRHWLNFFIKFKKKQLTRWNERKQLVHMTCSVHSHRHDVLTVSLTILLHRSITRVTCTLSC